MCHPVEGLWPRVSAPCPLKYNLLLPLLRLPCKTHGCIWTRTRAHTQTRTLAHKHAPTHPRTHARTHPPTQYTTQDEAQSLPHGAIGFALQLRDGLIFDHCVHACMCACMRACVHACVYMCACMRVRVHVGNHTCMCVSVDVHWRMCAYMSIHTDHARRQIRAYVRHTATHRHVGAPTDTHRHT